MSRPSPRSPGRLGAGCTSSRRGLPRRWRCTTRSSYDLQAVLEDPGVPQLQATRHLSAVERTPEAREPMADSREIRSWTIRPPAPTAPTRWRVRSSTRWSTPSSRRRRYGRAPASPSSGRARAPRQAPVGRTQARVHRKTLCIRCWVWRRRTHGSWPRCARASWSSVCSRTCVPERPTGARSRPGWRAIRRC